MIIDRYEPMNLFDLVPKLLAHFEPELQELDQLLEDDAIFQLVKADLARRHKHSLTCGRHGTPVEVILRLLVVKRLYKWSYEDVEHFVGDSLVLRQFCRVYLQRVPEHTVLLRWANLIGPQTMERINDRVVELARSLKVTRGRKLRIDSTVVETNIHHPTDSRLLGDGVRVLSRLLHKAKKVIDESASLGQEAFRNRSRSVRRLAQQIHRVARRKGEERAEQLKEAYGKLIGIGRASREQAEQVCEALGKQTGERVQALVGSLEHFLPLVDQAIEQAQRRVIEGEVVPAGEKLLSLFEPHTQIIITQKPGKSVQFGRKLVLDEVDGGIISRYEVAQQPGQDYAYLKASLEGHRRRFGRAPYLLAGDRGLYTEENEKLAKEQGVKRIVLPKTGRVSPERHKQERQGWFRRGYRFRAGIEGRISVLKRCQGLDRCRDHGEEGFGRWVGWGIVVANLGKIAHAQATRTAA
jgi:transposase, IS5 family